MSQHCISQQSHLFLDTLGTLGTLGTHPNAPIHTLILKLVPFAAGPVAAGLES
jgi:hypothetical protein